ncbi:MAG: hypothetical protein DHS20C21_12120 [Gemmatimonadota bacterium]|nr:MAG: hypothetical protein DHS20C21_12120 [Gemmatimonadota bacterium]
MLQARASRIAIPVAALAFTLGADPRPSAAGNLWPSPDWVVSTPEEQGMDTALLEQARDFALTGAGSGIVVRAGYSVMTWGSQSSRKELKSATKSFGATLLGVAIEDGLATLEDAADIHYPDMGLPPVANDTTGWLPQISLFDLATHSAGFDKPGGYIPLENEPGTQWQYSDGGANWLADVLTVAFGEDLESVMFTRVLTPLGIGSSDFQWRDNAYRADTIEGIKSREFASGISADVDAMARLGYLYLRGGEWDGLRILPTSFVAQAATSDPSIAGLPEEDPVKYPNATDHYGLLWWNNNDGALSGVPTDTYWAWGLNENLIVVMPSYDLVVARGSDDGWQSGWSGDYSVLAPFLQPIAAAVTVVSTGVDEGLPESSWGSIKSRFRTGSTDQ